MKKGSLRTPTQEETSTTSRGPFPDVSPWFLSRLVSNKFAIDAWKVETFLEFFPGGISCNMRRPSNLVLLFFSPVVVPSVLSPLAVMLRRPGLLSS